MCDILGNYTQHIINHSNKRHGRGLWTQGKEKQYPLYQATQDFQVDLNGWGVFRKGEFRKQGLCVPARVCAHV